MNGEHFRILKAALIAIVLLAISGVAAAVVMQANYWIGQVVVFGSLGIVILWMYSDMNAWKPST